MYFQEVREYVADLVGCLREKSEQIGEVRHVLLAGVADAAKVRDQRRREAQDDHLRELGCKGERATGSGSREDGNGHGMGYGGGMGLGMGGGTGLGFGGGFGGDRAEETANGPFDSLNGYQLPPEGDSDDEGGYDEMGRDRSYYKSREKSQRREAREKRRKRAWSRAIRGNGRPPLRVTCAVDILSDSDDSEREDDAAVTRRDNLMAAADVVFEDVEPEYTSLARLKEVLEGWKRKFPDAYASAYVSVALPKLVAPIAELEVLGWPLLSNGVGLREGEAEGAGGLTDLDWVGEMADYSEGVRGGRAGGVGGWGGGGA